jgi:hypothetical protein
MHRNKTGIHLAVLRGLQGVFGYFLDTIAQTGDPPTDNPKTRKGIRSVSLSETGTIMQQPLRLPPQFDS